MRNENYYLFTCGGDYGPKIWTERAIDPDGLVLAQRRQQHQLLASIGIIIESRVLEKWDAN